MSLTYETANASFRTKLAGRASTWARKRRHRQFHQLTGITTDSSILDIGCGQLGLRALEPQLNITGVDLLPQPNYPGPFVQADATQRLPFADKQFDLVYCNSVIEHIPPSQRAAFVRELQRVAHGWYIQTPALLFPIEPHSLLPFAHWLPVAVRKIYWRLGVQGEWEQIVFLRKAQLQQLFGQTVPERIGPFTKSWVSFKAI